MSKRRRTSSAASSRQEDEMSEVEVLPESSRKRKRVDPSEICQQLYDTIRNFKKEDGGLLCDAFIRAPKRRQEPGYYEVVVNPIDMLKVQQKLRTEEYEDVDQLSTDIELMVNNAKSFYKRSSSEYKDATELWDLFTMTKSRLLDRDSTPAGDDGSEGKGKIILKARRAAAAEARRGMMDDDDESESSSIAPEEEGNALEELFTAVMMAQDADNRILHTVFQLLPSKKRYPEYYEVIDNPLDLKMIATRIQSGQYGTLSDLERDLLQMTKNACIFNEPGSQIYKDAKALRKIISVKKIEIEQGRSAPGKSSERIRNKRLRGSQCLSAITSALKYEEDDEAGDEEEEELGEPMEEEDDENVEDEAEDEEEGDDEEESSPLWQLFECVRGYSSSQGYLLSDPFRKLPSRRTYPDYYKEIKNPISLFQIRTKLRQGHYGTLSELAGDLNIMFENAKTYNRPDSRLYKDAVKLQKTMQAKVQELLEYDQESDSDEDEERSVKRRGPKPQRGRKPNEEPTLKKRLLHLYRTLIDHMEEGRQPILMFMEKPSKKLYPDYYQVIEQPIDMLTIEANIRGDKYTSEEQLVSDFRLMFNNCRQYNEEGSVIYEDANKLEKLLLEKSQCTGVGDGVRRFGPRTPAPRLKKLQSVLYQKLRTLFDTIRDHRDVKGRQLSVIFNKLPSKTEYPDYYEVIKRPIDLERIAQKLKMALYDSLDDMVSDFVLMFDNACKYNEPDSQIYKDALMLQRVALQTKLQLREDEESVPDVPAAVQELLTSLFTATYNHQDEEGRCFSDSMAELPEHDDVDGKKVRALSLDLLKRRLDRGLYRRLDMFQEDMFACLDRARRLSRSDSQVFEDAIELQAYFIKQRDELCRGGDLLHSPALRYSAQELAAALETLRQEKALRELPEEEGETRSSDDSFKVAATSVGDELTFNQQLYRVGDFVYLEPKERGLEPHIIHIERLWTNQENQQMLFGNYFYRPNETYHLTTRKFLEKEVFKSDVRTAVPLQQVIGLCCVLSVRDYLKLRPDGFPDKDVYVCESRYATKPRSFKKIKMWPFSLPDHIPLVPREEPIEPKRVMSVFRERVEKHKEEIAELEEGEKITEKEPPNVEIFNAQGIEGATYYEQFKVPCCVSIKTGDCVYVRTATGRQCVTQVDSIWVTKEGEAMFKGPWFVPPSEVPHTPARLFYKQELFLSSLEDTHPINTIIGRCAVLEHGEYISCRPTEVAEQDVYVCESLYEEARRQVHKLGRDGIRKYQHVGDAIEDEIYFFRRLINPAKVKVGSEVVKTEVKGILTHYERDASPLTTRDPEVSLLMEDSMDAPPSVGSGDTPTPSPSMPTPVSSKNKKGTGKKLVTGYILYSSDVRKTVAGKFPESSFGEISRIVGNEWRNLPTSEKQIYEERAARMNEETSARLAQEALNPNNESNNPEVVFECMWDNCDWQFDDINDLIEHCVQEPSGHVQQHFVTNPEAEYQCQWKGCIRQKKTVPPFPSIMRLARHTKEQHIQKGHGRIIPMHERSKNYKSTRVIVAPPTNIVTAGTSSPAVVAAPVRQLEPMFVSVPPRPQRLLHSEAYIKYIEGMAAETRHISNWDKNLKSTIENSPVSDASRLPSQWLGNGVGNHGTIINALWALRDYMIRDALGLGKNTT